MAESVIKAGCAVTAENWTARKVGTNTTVNSGFLVINDDMKIVEWIASEIQTGAALSAGQYYDFGTVPFKPVKDVWVDVNRRDSGNAVGTITIMTSGNVRLWPLMAIPTGVWMRAHATYFYQ